MQEFSEILQRAEGLLAERPLRTTLTEAEISRIAEFHYAEMLAEDEAFTVEGAAEDEAFTRSIAEQLTEAGIEFGMSFPLDPQGPPTFGLSNRQLGKRADYLDEDLPAMRAALARGDISTVAELLTELLDRFHLNLDTSSAAYRKLGLAVLRAEVRTLEALERRSRGEPIETPVVLEPEAPKGPEGRSLATPVALASSAPPGQDRDQRSLGASTLHQAFEGWQKEGNRSAGTAAEYQRALSLFTELHGELPIAHIRKQDALQFRQALQEVPRGKSKTMARLTLPELVEWHKAHPSSPCLTPATVNKLLGGVQAIAQWAIKNGLVPEDTRDAFAGMKLQIDERGGGPFEPEELHRLFASSIFTEGERPPGCQGDTAFWLPLMALFTGCRRSELMLRKTGDIAQEDGQWCLLVRADKQAGQTLKTAGSARTIPIHPELIRLGLLEYVKLQARPAASARGAHRDGWLFPAVVADKAANTWSAWLGRWLNRLGLGGGRRGLHGLRHCFRDALRAGRVPDDLGAALMGWSDSTMGRLYGARAAHPSQRHKVIVQRFGMPRLVEAISAVQFPTINLEAVRWRP